jgi:hypothetical protein
MFSKKATPDSSLLSTSVFESAFYEISHQYKAPTLSRHSWTSENKALSVLEWN